MKRKLILIFAILVLWQMASGMIQKEVILPYPGDVLQQMVAHLFQQSFYIAVISTIIRVMIGFFLALIIGVFLGILSGLFSDFRQYIQPLMTFFQTIPQIGYILILLVWFSSHIALLIIIFLMLVPTFYFNTLQGMLHIDSDLQDIIQLYHHSFLYNLRYAYLPLIQGYILSAIQTTLPLGLKVGVMTEIFVSTQYGIGKQLYLARVQIDMTSIFAWVLWMALMAFLMIKLSDILIQFIQKKNHSL